MLLKNAILESNTGLDAIKRAPILNYQTNLKCLRIQDISQNKKYELWGNTKVDDKIKSQYLLKTNDIILARTGSTIGINTFIKKDMNAVYNNGLICLKVDINNYIPYYIYLFLKTKQYKNFIDGISGSSATQPNLRINDLLMLELPDYNLETQQHIVDTIYILYFLSFFYIPCNHIH